MEGKHVENITSVLTGDKEGLQRRQLMHDATCGDTVQGGIGTEYMQPESDGAVSEKARVRECCVAKPLGVRKQT